ncbi:MAG TPA: hypothetical protein VFT95_23975, partial [Micromonosporaceae bacterium]|nr:hypothetical protein [Micromonosporaceae bacterium]
DEGFVGWGAEDMELGYRLHHAGVRLVMSRRAWAIETPHRRDVAANLASNIQNLRLFQSKHDCPETELFCACRRRRVPVQQAYAEFEAWTSAVRSLDVRAELAELAGDPSHLVGGRVAVLGGGVALPDGWPACTVLDFDSAALAKAVAGTPHTGRHAIGVRTLLPDGSFDLVLVSSRLSGLWDTWGEDVLAEARRLGRQVRAFPDLPEPQRAW